VAKKIEHVHRWRFRKIEFSPWKEQKVTSWDGLSVGRSTPFFPRGKWVFKIIHPILLQNVRKILSPFQCFKKSLCFFLSKGWLFDFRNFRFVSYALSFSGIHCVCLHVEFNIFHKGYFTTTGKHSSRKTISVDILACFDPFNLKIWGKQRVIETYVIFLFFQKLLFPDL